MMSKDYLSLSFHNESHHPHVHLMVYSTEEKQAYLSKEGVMKLRSSFAKDIFAQDLLCVYERQTEYRDELKVNSREVISKIISKINSGIYDNPKLEEMLLTLADRLSKTSGKKVYGYLKADVKAIIDSIVDELADDERISALYDLWYEQRESVIKTYTDELLERVPLSQNKEFRSIKNAVMQEAMNIVNECAFTTEDEENVDEQFDYEPSDEESEPTLTDKEKTSLMWQYYKKAKDLLDRDNEDYDPNTAVEFLIESAKLGCGVAKYHLGKMFLRGEGVSKNVDYALRWLEESVSEKNEYAEYLLGKTYLKGEDVEQDLIRAEDLLRKSSAQGNKYAKYTLGKSLIDGELLLQNIPEAIKLISENKLKSGGNDVNETIEAEGNLQDVVELLANLRKNKEPLLHCSVFIELKAKNMDALKELQSEIAMELTRSKISVDRLTLRQKEGFLSVLPVGANQFGAQYERVLPASSVANLYPFNFSGKTDPQGVYIGRDKFGSNVLVDFDRRAEDKTTSNILILGNSGQGKSYLLKLILTNIRESGKSVICLDPESEYEEICSNLGGCYIDFLSGKYIINPLESKSFGAGGEDNDTDMNERELGAGSACPTAFKKVTRLSQHIAFLKDFFRAYKDFSDTQIDTIEILLSKLYARFGITDSTDYSKMKSTDYPIMEDFYNLCEEEFMTYDNKRKYLYTEETLP